MIIAIRNGDAVEELRRMDEESIDCCITSPPYYGLRDYGVDGQIGLEATPQEYIKKLVGVFREVRYVLKKRGTLWVNIGDSYSSQGGKQVAQTKWLVEGASDGQNGGKSRVAANGLKPKDLIGIPWMLAFALRDDGWYLRQDIIWHKPNPMPESVKDRCTKAHEYVFMLSKSQQYFYDSDAVSEPATYAGRVITLGEKSLSKGQANGAKVVASGNGCASSVLVKDTRNLRSVWILKTQPSQETHFATFPLTLPVTCMLAGCPERGTVLDPFAGTGTTGEGALRNNRGFVGIELNTDYYEIMRKRINKRIPTNRAL